MENIISLVPEQLLILVAAIYVLGEGCKKYPNLNNRYIPLVLLAFGIAFSIWILGISPNAILQGILCWGTAIGLNQTIKQLSNNKESE